jgi:hypothetical protein
LKKEFASTVIQHQSHGTKLKGKKVIIGKLQRMHIDQSAEKLWGEWQINKNQWQP